MWLGGFQNKIGVRIFLDHTVPKGRETMFFFVVVSSQDSSVAANLSSSIETKLNIGQKYSFCCHVQTQHAEVENALCPSSED
jgi:hypothetical protein